MNKVFTTTGITVCLGGALTTILSGVGLYIRTEIANLRTSINTLNTTMNAIQISIVETQKTEEFMIERMNHYREWLIKIERRINKIESRGFTRVREK